jgi:deaminated glutathione amidase
MNPSNITVAAIQLSSQADVALNLAECERWVRAAATAGAKLILLPENFAFFGPDVERLKIAEPLARTGTEGSPIQSALSAWAKALGVTIVGGGMPVASDDPERPYNSAVAFGPDGRLLEVYNKVHLFDVDLADGTRLSESARTKPGAAPASVDVLGFRVGMSICYDVRFPELYRRLVDQGAEVLLVPAAFTLHTGKDHWTTLLKARAIESQCWLIAAAQWGTHPGNRRCFGHSMVVDPWGAVVAECSDHTGFVVATIDRDYLKSVRAGLPSLKHRRLG